MKLPSWLIEQKLVKKYKTIGALLAAIGVNAEDLTQSAVASHWTTYEPEGIVDGHKIKIVFHARRFPGNNIKIENPRIQSLDGDDEHEERSKLRPEHSDDGSDNRSTSACDSTETTPS